MIVTVAAEAKAKAETLIEALPYMRAYQGATVVLKIGGEVLLDPTRAASLAQDVALLCLVGVRIVLVHGGGPQVSAAMRAGGFEPLFVNGLRVTDDACMTVTQATLLGDINPRLVTILCAAGVPAVGLSGTDGGMVQARRIDALGRVGAVTTCRTDLVRSLLEAGYTPVVASVAPGDDGEPLNVNADAVAAALAGALRAEKLVYMTNVRGLYRTFGDEASLISEISAEDLAALADGLSDGMRPKAEGALAALRAGIGKVHLLDGRAQHALLLEIFTQEGIGTVVVT